MVGEGQDPLDPVGQLFSSLEHFADISLSLLILRKGYRKSVHLYPFSRGIEHSSLRSLYPQISFYRSLIARAIASNSPLLHSELF